jgi:hypothetical protein
VYKIYFWVSFCRPWFLWPETKKLVIPFLRIYLFASLLSVHCVSPHRWSHKLRRISTLKPNIIFFVTTSLTTTYHWGRIINSRKIARRCQRWRFQVSLQGKISGTYLIFRLFARGRATSKHGGGGRYGAVLEFKREYLKKIYIMMKEKKTSDMHDFQGIKKSKLHCESHGLNIWRGKKKNEWMKERKEWERKKYIFVRKVNSPVL